MLQDAQLLQLVRTLPLVPNAAARRMCEAMAARLRRESEFRRVVVDERCSLFECDGIPEGQVVASVGLDFGMVSPNTMAGLRFDQWMDRAERAVRNNIARRRFEEDCRRADNIPTLQQLVDDLCARHLERLSGMVLHAASPGFEGSF